MFLDNNNIKRLSCIDLDRVLRPSGVEEPAWSHSDLSRQHDAARLCLPRQGATQRRRGLSTLYTIG